MKSKSIKELIGIIINPPNEYEGQKAKEILEYRKFRAQYISNIIVAIFTILMALSTTIQAIKLFLPE
jgi:hypothetical protein